MKKTLYTTIFLLGLIIIFVACQSTADDVTKQPDTTNSTNISSDTSINREQVISLDITATVLREEFVSKEGMELCYVSNATYQDNILLYSKIVEGQKMYGYMDSSFNKLSDAISFKPSLFHNGFAFIETDDGEQVINSNFEIISIDTENPFVYQNQVYVLETYEDGERFLVEEDDGYLSIKPDILLPIENKSIILPYYVETNTVLQEDNENTRETKYGYITVSNILNNTLQWELPCIYEDAKRFYEGYAPVKINGKWGIIDQKGEIVIDFIYDFMSEVTNNLAIAGTYGESSHKIDTFHLYNFNRDIVFDYDYDYYMGISDNMVLFKNEDNQAVYIREYGGPIIIEEPYVATSHFHNQIALIMVNNTYQFIDILGNNIYQEIYDDAYDFSNGVAAIKKDGSWGFINEFGVFLIEPIYDKVSSFSNDFAFASESNQSFIIDKEGNKYLEDLKLVEISLFNEQGTAIGFTQGVDDDSTTRTYYRVQATIQNVKREVSLPQEEKGKIDGRVYGRIVDHIKTIQSKAIYIENLGDLETHKQLFDANRYFEFLTHLSLNEGTILDYFMLPATGIGTSGPLLFTRDEDDLPDFTQFYKVGEQNRVEWNGSPDIERRIYMSDILLDGSVESMVEYIILDTIGDQFALWWHSNYNDLIPVFTKEHINNIMETQIREVMIKEGFYDKASNIDPSIIIERSDTEISVNILCFTNWGGFFRRTYTFNNKEAYELINKTEKNILPYDCGIMF